MDMLEDDVIWWAGWETNWKNLRSAGWEIILKQSYSNWKKPQDTHASRSKIYIRHPKSKQMGRIILNSDNVRDGYYELEFLIQECNQRVKPPKYVKERQYNESDIEPMLEAIVSIQSKRPKRKKPLPNADIFYMEDIA